MIKIPKSLNELKTMLSDANFGDALTKVQATMNSASSAVQAAVSPRLEGELGQVVEQLKKLHEQEDILLKRLAELTTLFQHEMTALKQELALAKPPEPVPVEEPKAAEVVVESATEMTMDTDVTPMSEAESMAESVSSDKVAAS